jgi:hypothetical protein
MAKPTEIDTKTNTSSSVRFGNGKYSLTAPPFPPASANDKMKANAFNWWEKSILEQLELGEVPVLELMNVLGDHIPIEPIAAKLVAKSMREETTRRFFKHGCFRGRGFSDEDHDEMPFEEKDIKDRPTGLQHYRFRTTVDPVTLYPYVIEPLLEATFDLALKQTEGVTANPGAATAPSTGSVIATPRRLFGTPAPTDIASLTAQSPAFAAQMKSKFTTSTTVVSYHGHLDFLDCQEGFDEVFPNPVPLDIVEDPKVPVAKAIKSFAENCGLYAYLHALREDYVGTTEDLSLEAINGIGESLRKYRMEYTVQGKQLKATPTAVYKKFMALAYLLPEDCQQWGFTFYDLFMNALTAKIRKGILESATFKRPDFRKLVTGADQRNSLMKLKNEADKIFKKLKEEEDRFRETCREFAVASNKGSSHQRASAHVGTAAATDQTRKAGVKQEAPSYAAVLKHNVSAAEETIGRAKASSGGKHDRDAVYPVDPKSGKVSDFPVGFFGCYSCGDPTHRFNDCTKKGEPDAKSRFYKNYNAHEKHIKEARAKREEQRGKSNSSAYGQVSTPLYYGNDASVANRDSEQRDNIKHKEEEAAQDEGGSSRSHAVFAQTVKVLHGSTGSKTRAMPVAVQNKLPSINLSLGLKGGPGTKDVQLNVLFDTCGALSTGFKPYHDFIRRKHPEVVYDYEEFDSANPFDTIKLSGALRDPNNIAMEVVGTLDAVIQYKTPYFDKHGKPVLLAFALGNTVSCNTIMGLPAIKGMEMEWNIKKEEITAQALSGPGNKFPVTLREAEYGLPKPERARAEEIKTAPPGIRRNPVAQFHCLARHYQRPFGGAHGTLSNKQVTFTSNVISTVQHWANASKTCARKIVDPSGRESTIRVPSLLIDVPTKMWRPKQLNNWQRRNKCKRTLCF